MEVIFSAKGGHVSGVKQTQSRPKNERFQPVPITYALRSHLFFKRLRGLIPIIFILTISTAILWVNCATNDGRDKELLAIIGNRVIDKKDFIARYKELRAKIDLPDNGQSRREIFNTLLEEKLFIIEAEKRGYDRDADGRFQRERLQMQELLDAFHRRFVANGIEVSENELRQLFIR